MEKHGKASLIVHLVIVKNLEDVAFVDQVLNAIASSHVFLSKLSTSIQVEIKYVQINCLIYIFFCRNTMKYYLNF